ncbi:MAG: YceI family protein [Dokdonella sp.]|uniref:YceI family protein n=1 Tax=Dokdonella sp. TaxID=2291710 RepID=UPI003263C5D0
MGRHVILAAAIAGVLVAFAARARPAFAALAGDDAIEVIQLDPTNSHVDFRVKLMWLLRVGGRFGAVNGSVRIDRFRNQVSVDARIAVDTVSMNSASAEAWIKSPEFFDVAHFPMIEFASDPFPQARLRDGGEVPGTLTLRGIERPVRFQMQPADCERPAYDCPIEVAGTVPRSEFGMRSRHGTLSDRVELRLSVRALAPAAR